MAALESAMLALLFLWVGKHAPDNLKNSREMKPNLSKPIDLNCSHEVTCIDPKQLTPHPFNQALYGDCTPDEGFLQTIRDNGIQTPLLITEDNQIISGHRRHAGALKLELPFVPTIKPVGQFTDEDIIELILDGNRSRKKSNEMLIREYIAYKRIESAKAKQRQATDGKTDGKNSTQGKARDIAADKVDLSGVAADAGAKIVNIIDTFAAEGRHDESNTLRDLLNNKSFNTAETHARLQGWWPEIKPKTNAKKPSAPAVDKGEARAQTPKAETTPSGAPPHVQPNLAQSRRKGNGGLVLAELGHGIKEVFSAPSKPVQSPEPDQDLAPPDEPDDALEGTGSNDNTPITPELPISTPADSDDDDARLTRKRPELRNLDHALELLEDINETLLSTSEIPPDRRPAWSEAAEYIARNLRTLEVPVAA